MNILWFACHRHWKSAVSLWLSFVWFWILMITHGLCDDTTWLVLQKVQWLTARASFQQPFLHQSDIKIIRSNWIKLWLITLFLQTATVSNLSILIVDYPSNFSPSGMVVLEIHLKILEENYIRNMSCIGSLLPKCTISFSYTDNLVKVKLQDLPRIEVNCL